MTLDEFLSDDEEATLNRLRRLEELLDRQFSVGGFRFGLDAVIGLIPVAGDLITGAIGLYIISEARRFNLSRWTLGRMYTNWAIDVGVGAIPLAGDMFDAAFKSNTMNVRLLISELERREKKARRKASRGEVDIVELSPAQAKRLKPARTWPDKR